MISILNSPVMYFICGMIILFVAIVSAIFLIRAYRAGKAIGMDSDVLKRAITSSATFSILPSVGILLGVIALSGSLGTPWPWLRLSVIGALHYETQVAQGAAEQVGLTSLSAAQMTPRAFATIAFLMSICIMWGMILSIFFNKMYLGRIGGRQGAGQDGRQGAGAQAKSGETPNKSGTALKGTTLKGTALKGTAEKGTAPRQGFGDAAMIAMFIGLVSAYIGSYIGGFVSGNGRFAFRGSFVPIIVAAVSAAVMALFTWLAEKKNMVWLESFSIAGSMLIGMLAAIFFG
ncbi:MAG: DUF5058 family protein [Lachnospiraceae bacterium]|nr:DUF5058 family protein [Lachnospiraceae bacterium]